MILFFHVPGRGEFISFERNSGLGAMARGRHRRRVTWRYYVSAAQTEICPAVQTDFAFHSSIV